MFSLLTGPFPPSAITTSAGELVLASPASAAAPAPPGTGGSRGRWRGSRRRRGRAAPAASPSRRARAAPGRGSRRCAASPARRLRMRPRRPARPGRGSRCAAASGPLDHGNTLASSFTNSFTACRIRVHEVAIEPLRVRFCKYGPVEHRHPRVAIRRDPVVEPVGVDAALEHPRRHQDEPPIGPDQSEDPVDVRLGDVTRGPELEHDQPRQLALARLALERGDPARERATALGVDPVAELRQVRDREADDRVADQERRPAEAGVADRRHLVEPAAGLDRGRVRWQHREAGRDENRRERQPDPCPWSIH